MFLSLEAEVLKKLLTEAHKIVSDMEEVNGN